MKIVFQMTGQAEIFWFFFRVFSCLVTSANSKPGEDDTKRKLVNHNYPLRLGHCDSWQENAKINHFDCQPEVFGW